MKRLVYTMLGIVFSVGIATGQKADVTVWPAPAGEALSEQFTVEVENVEAPVYIAKVAPLDKKLRFKAMDDKVNSALYFDRASFACFDISGEATVKIKSPEKIDSVKILPSSARVEAEIENNTIEFRIRPGQNLTVEINGDIIHSLHLFANPVERDTPGPNDPGLVYFGPGIHEITRLILRSNQTLYLAGGAILKTVIGKEENPPYHPSITLMGDNIKVMGRGIIDGSALPTHARNMLLIQGNNISVEGIILRDAAVWTVPVRMSKQVHINNIKLIGYRANSDGIDICNSENVLVENCFIRTLDDLIVVKTQKGRGLARNITVRKNVLWNEVAHALSIGAEINEDISDISFSDCDIIHDRGREWALRIYHCDAAQVKNVRFENIRIEECQKLISLWINKDVWTTDTLRGHIDDVSFKNISATGRPATIQLLGYGEENLIDNVSFNDIKINGSEIGVDEIGRNEYVQNISVNNKMYHLKTSEMKKTILAGALALGVMSAQAQAFEESMGAVGGNVSVSAYHAAKNFKNSSNLTFSGSAEVQLHGASTPKNTYTTLFGEASSGANVRIADVPGTDFVVSGINTKDLESPVFGFGILKGTVASDGSDLAVEYSLDGRKWKTLLFEALPTGEGTALVWMYRTAPLPQAEKISVRFKQTGGGCVYRIDDVGVNSKED